MMYLFSQLWLCFLLAGVFGLATGWWIWGAAARESLAETDGYGRVEAPVIPPAPDKWEPELDDEPVTAEPEAEDNIAPRPEFAEDIPQSIAPLPDPEDADAPVAEESGDAEPIEEAPALQSPFLDAPDGEPDKLTHIKGVGPKLGDMLNALGVYHFRQIADWDSDQIAEVDSRLGSFSGRIVRDEWVDQAALLAEGNIAAFERRFGKLNGPL